MIVQRYSKLEKLILESEPLPTELREPAQLGFDPSILGPSRIHGGHDRVRSPTLAPPLVLPLAVDDGTAIVPTI